MILYLCFLVRYSLVFSVATRPRLDDEASVAQYRLPKADSPAILFAGNHAARAGGGGRVCHATVWMVEIVSTIALFRTTEVPHKK